MFLMFNDSYLPGALTAAYGLRKQASPSKRVCVVTPEITDKARRMLRTIFDDVVEILPIGAPDDMDDGAPQELRTGSARVQSAVLTRFASLLLGPGGGLDRSYKKVVVIDADLLPLRDFEDLWTLRAPAGIINEHRSHMAEIDDNGELIVRPESLATGEWVWHDVYGDIAPHGAPIPAEITNRVASDFDNYGVNASLVILEPSVETYQRFMAWAATDDIRPLIRRRWKWVDQQAATLFWSGEWTNVDASYSAFYGYPSLEMARGLHFAGVKPWSWRKKGFLRRMRRFPDYRYWSEVFLEMVDQIPELGEHGGLRKLAENTEDAFSAF